MKDESRLFLGGWSLGGGGLDPADIHTTVGPSARLSQSVSRINRASFIYESTNYKSLYTQHLLVGICSGCTKRFLLPPDIQSYGVFYIATNQFLYRSITLRIQCVVFNGN